MRRAHGIEMSCWCGTLNHEAGCPVGWVVAERARLYDGLYDGAHEARGVRRIFSGALKRVRLLNPAYADEDAQGRRFALLEID